MTVTVVRVQTLSVGVEPLEAGERLSAHVAVDQHAASLPRYDLLHFGEDHRDEPDARRRAVLSTVLGAVSVGGAGGQEGGRQQKRCRRRQQQQTVAIGGEHCH